MSDTTTVRVGRATRDHLRRISTENGETLDAVIQQALGLLEWEALRRQAEAESRALANDPADRAEVQAAIRDALGK